MSKAKFRSGKINPKFRQSKPDPITIEQKPGIGHNSGASSVPARLIDEGRKNSNQIIQALSNAALALSGKENAVVQVEIMERLWKMQREAENIQSEREFGIAKVALAMALPTIPKRHKIEFVDRHNQKQEREYADRVDIESVLDPLCRLHGFSKEYSTVTNDKGWAAQALTVRHVGGHKEVYLSPYMPLDTSGAKNNNQGAGSTAEYGKRYAVVGAFNIIGVDWDNDGATVEDKPVGDKFAERVQADTPKEAKQEPPVSSKPVAAMSLPDAAKALEERLLALPVDQRGERLMLHIKVIAAMEADTELAPKAAELRKLCEVTNG